MPATFATWLAAAMLSGVGPDAAAPIPLDGDACAVLYALQSGKPRNVEALARARVDQEEPSNEFARRRAMEGARTAIAEEARRIEAARAFLVEAEVEDEFAWLATYDFDRGAFPVRTNPGLSFRSDGAPGGPDRCVAALGGGPDEFLLAVSEAEGEKLVVGMREEDRGERHVGVRLVLVPTGRHFERGGDAVVEFRVTRAAVLVGGALRDATPAPSPHRPPAVTPGPKPKRPRSPEGRPPPPTILGE